VAALIDGLPEVAPVRSLRVSVTDRCNLRCRYCRSESGSAAGRERLPSLDRLARAAIWLVDHAAARRVRLTGGEPLLREGVDGLVGRLSATPGVAEVTMTTNGTRLAALAGSLRAAGLRRVNVSLDTLDRRRFAELTRGGNVAVTVAGIDAALAAGLVPLKLNAVLRRSSFREDIPDLLDFAAERGVEIRFIELMRTGTEAAWAAAELVSAVEVQRLLHLELQPLAPEPSSPARRTAVRWRGRDRAVGWITPVSHAFCDGCDRLRLDARGRVRRCLMDGATLPLLERLEAGDAGVSDRLRTFLRHKRLPSGMATDQPMSTIGG
jgi:GTP 3',8-cyclase